MKSIREMGKIANGHGTEVALCECGYCTTLMAFDATMDQMGKKGATTEECMNAIMDYCVQILNLNLGEVVTIASLAGAQLRVANALAQKVDGSGELRH